ncbi:hypothetical protein A167_01547 [Alcanivorax sp. S71-1-4]|uniref:hypothetical protein n=1 Tax=Alcanivorax sp. S71-1-4 TaxID=1177159 RepID=UPI001357DCA2|nr:hypothetical protein [Alcanivorax sp. S71-1-4]KAF0809731.1 hypothetical protein A167_01547 [Alcanivorax sp. S71-1-4]
MFLDALPSGELDQALFAEAAGNWHYIRFFRFPDIDLTDAATGVVTARLTQRSAATRVWWNNGPQFYTAIYGHNVTAVSASTPHFSTRLIMKNQGGGTELVQDIADHVSCRDTDRRSVWTFSITGEQSEYILRAAATLFGPVQWEACA